MVFLLPLSPTPGRGREGGLLRTAHTAVGLGMAGYFKQHMGEFGVTLETGRMQPWVAAAHLCSARGLYGGEGDPATVGVEVQR